MTDEEQVASDLQESGKAHRRSNLWGWVVGGIVTVVIFMLVLATVTILKVSSVQSGNGNILMSVNGVVTKLGSDEKAQLRGNHIVSQVLIEAGAAVSALERQEIANCQAIRGCIVVIATPGPTTTTTTTTHP